MNYYDSLVSAARRWPKQPAIIDEYGLMTFDELWRETAKLTKALRQSGVEERHGVGIMIGNNRYFLMSLYAVLACDAVVMPLAPMLSREEVLNMIAEGNLHFVVADRVRHTIAPVVQHFQFSPLTLFRTSRSSDRPTVEFLSDAAVMRFTSGTTGDAKCVILSHRTLWERTEAANKGLRLNSSDRILWVLPMAYHFIVSILLYVRYGVGLIVCEDFLAENLLNRANDYKATVLYGAPLHIRLLAKTKGDARFTSLQRVVSTTTGIGAEICKAFFERHGIPVIQALGIIEVGIPLINGTDAARNPVPLAHNPTIKQAIICVRPIRVLDRPPSQSWQLEPRRPEAASY
jgi:acyl-coenzyme A synthetase/AMP-(fatty) acid ligase